MAEGSACAMTDTTGQAGGQNAPGQEGLTQDWLTLWRSELAGMAVDRELRESWAAMTGLWAQTMQDAAAAAARAAAAPHEPAGRAGADAPAGPAPAAAAPDPRLDEIEQLNRRVAELERRLAAGPGGAKPVRAARPARRRGAD
jgi:hypothetical protein